MANWCVRAFGSFYVPIWWPWGLICIDQNNRETQLADSIFVCNTTSHTHTHTHTQTKYCPLELAFGRKPFVSGLLQSRPRYPDDSERISVLKQTLQYSHEGERRALINSKQMWSDFVLNLSEVKWSEMKFLGTTVPCILGWPYTEGTWLYCDCFIWCVFYTVVVLTYFVLCVCVCVCIL